MSKIVELSAEDITPQGGIFCPNPAAGMDLWNSHPKVHLDIADAEGHVVTCPYCGTQYQLKEGETLAGGH